VAIDGDSGAGPSPAAAMWSSRAPAFAAAALLGVVHALSFAPQPRGWLEVGVLALLFAAIDRAASWRRAAWLGFAFGCGWFGDGFAWLYISMHDYGDLPGWMAAAAEGALAAGLALLPAAAAAAGWLSSRGPLSRPLLALPACWALGEWLRGIVFTGFPWLAGGYAHTDGGLAGLAPIVGVYGVTLAAAALAGALVAAWRTRARPPLAAAIVVIGGVALAGATAARRIDWTTPDGRPISVRLVQGNIPQDLKFGVDGMARAIETHARLMRGDGRHADLVVLPESVFPVPLGDLPADLLPSIVEFGRQQHAAIVFGAFIEDPPGHFLNSALGLEPGAATYQHYSKRHLVPFGEYIPPGFRWFVDLMRIPIGDQDRGPDDQPPMRLAGQDIAVNICYEDLFGAEIIRAWQDPRRAPTILLNVSNLAWFGNSAALPQHLQIARMRAIETGRPMLRATNTGATAIIGPHGDVDALLPFLAPGALEGTAQGYRGATPYVRVGNAPFVALATLLLAGALASRRRVPPAKHEGAVKIPVAR